VRSESFGKRSEGSDSSIGRRSSWPEVAVLDGPRHLLYGPETVRYEFFDLSQDPEEKQDLFDEGGPLPEIAKLKEKLETFARDVVKNKKDVAIDKKAEEMLKALGYVGNKMP